MVRRTVCLAAVATMLGWVVGLTPATASGGGACPPPLTNDRTTTVEIKNFCFGPTVVHVAPGDSVTWINRDAFEHSVTGANRAFGSYRLLRQNRRVSWLFERPGVYPYYCVAHLGMVGAVVVGGSDELAGAGDVRRGEVKRAPALAPSSAELPPASDVPAATEPDLRAVLAAAAVAVIAVASVRLRRRVLARRVQ